MTERQDAVGRLSVDTLSLSRVSRLTPVFKSMFGVVGSVNTHCLSGIFVLGLLTQYLHRICGGTWSMPMYTVTPGTLHHCPSPPTTRGTFPYFSDNFQA